MTIQAATPYLILSGKAEQAIELYRTALGATTEVLTRFGEMNESCPVAQRDLVMHAALRVGKALLMLSDGPGEGEVPRGGAVSVALELNDAAETRRLFDALAASGTVVQPIIDAPWGGLFGAVLDRFGVSWMFNCSQRSS
jgi:PhnB protein